MQNTALTRLLMMKFAKRMVQATRQAGQAALRLKDQAKPKQSSNTLELAELVVQDIIVDMAIGRMPRSEVFSDKLSYLPDYLKNMIAKEDSRFPILKITSMEAAIILIRSDSWIKSIIRWLLALSIFRTKDRLTSAFAAKELIMPTGIIQSGLAWLSLQK